MENKSKERVDYWQFEVPGAWRETKGEEVLANFLASHSTVDVSITELSPERLVVTVLGPENPGWGNRARLTFMAAAMLITG